LWRSCGRRTPSHEADAGVRCWIMNDTGSLECDKKQALQRFVIANRDLETLEALAKRFNIFEALGVVRAERNHSKFMGFLLNPRGSHGLGDRFLKRFLQTALEYPPKVDPLTPIEIDLLDLSEAEILFEHDNIDVLIRDAQNRINVIVENKVGSAQHSDQLATYYRLEIKRYPERRVFGIYLTVDGDDPENDHYAAISHSGIWGLVNEVFMIPGLHIDKEVQFALKQYSDVLGRHFMADEQIKTLCERIYKQHKQAIDLVVSHRPNPRAVICETLRELVEANVNLILDDCSNAYFRFIPKALDLPYFNCASGWTSSNRLFLFEFQIRDKSVLLIIQMGPGDLEKRKQIHDFALANKKVFQVEKKFYESWQSLFRKPIVEGLDGGIDQEQLIQLIKSKWKEFVESDLPAIEQAFLTHKWSKS
jgi:hypothetical protein